MLRKLLFAHTGKKVYYVNDWRYRNSRKFCLKYGFDPHKFADGWALGLNDEDLAQFLGIHPSILESFKSVQYKRKNLPHPVYRTP